MVLKGKHERETVAFKTRHFKLYTDKSRQTGEIKHERLGRINILWTMALNVCLN